MEAFGKNLQRKTLYEEFYKGNREMSEMANKKDSLPSDIKDKVQHISETMKKIMMVNSVESSNLKN